MQIEIDVDRLTAELERLATISDCPEPPPAVTRVVFTETDLAARALMRELYHEAGLDVRVDPIGNTFARWPGSEPNAAAVGTGSHVDAIPHAGMYDGTVGVVGGLEAIRALKRAGLKPRRSIEVVAFTSEEPTRFGVGCTGSRAMAGLLSEDDLTKLVDAAGDNYDVVRRRAGFSGPLRDAVLPDDYYHAWIELHIEQGPELEAAGLPIGIVTAIAAPATLQVTVHGEGGHAGAVLMPGRKDALFAAAEMVAAIERIARECPSDDLVATVGKLEVHPGASNSIPSRITFTLDVRDVRRESRDDVLAQITAALNAVGDRRGTRLEIATLNCDPPATSDPAVVAAIRSACDQSGHRYQEMFSRAYHDSVFLAQKFPMAMIFIPCRNGVSHRPDEYSSPAQIAAGVEVLAHALAELAR
jgi:N-carbamoyl-L-amino-acid hydrolase